jgi:predicted RNase H-like HicB family nuclease
MAKSAAAYEFMDFYVDERMHPVSALEVTANWDPEAKVWVAESDDLPGLVVEAATLDELVPELEMLIPALMAENRVRAPLTDDRLHYRLNARISSSIPIPTAA